MSVTVNSPFKSKPRISRVGFITILERVGSFDSVPLWGNYPRMELPQIAGDIYDDLAANGHDPAVHLAIPGKEHTFGTNLNSVLGRNHTRSWTNARSVRHPDVQGEIITDSYRRSQYVRYQDVRDSVRDGWYRVDDPDFAYQRAGAKTIAEVIAIWAPADDANDPAGYAQTMVRWINSWAAEFPPEEEEPVSKLKVALAAGHRNSDGGGGPHEQELVRYHCRESATAFRNAGCEVRVVTPNEGMGMFPGGLQAVGRQVVTWANQGWTADIFIEFHTQGVGNSSSRGLFVIYPDRSPDVDVTIRDTLGRAIAESVSKETGIPIWSNGLMSERNTMVGLQGHRLGVFLATEPIRRTTTRMLIESGHTTNPSDLAILRRPETPAAIARGLVRTVMAHYGAGTDSKPKLDDPCTYYPQTGFYSCHGFRGFHDDNGGIPIFGYPLSREFRRVSENGKEVTSQWYERALFEWQPDIADNKHGVVLARIGAESRKADQEKYPEAFEPQEPPE